jgi:hypothetical protein
MRSLSSSRVVPGVGPGLRTAVCVSGRLEIFRTVAERDPPLAVRRAGVGFPRHAAIDDDVFQRSLDPAMVQGRALKEIPLMYKVASQTVSAWKHRHDG